MDTQSINKIDYRLSDYVNEKLTDEEYFARLDKVMVFHPNDAQILDLLIKKKIKNEKLPRNLVKLGNIYEIDPEKLADNYGKLSTEIWLYTFALGCIERKLGGMPVLVHAGTKQELMVKDKARFSSVILLLIKSNACRAQTKHWEDRVCIGKGRTIGYAPFLFSLVVINIILFVGSVLFGCCCWTLGVDGRCFSSWCLNHACALRKDPGYIKKGLGSNTDAEDPLLNTDLDSWMRNWTQLCPTCKI
ncbi:probable S-acyltransferase 23 [Olea europaea subsp. europaea]|uniref:Probable S-acyltransferase 23 n=1 Tax=Olea europaea subsp. europaea TaxID=158383 RepID=A0A8S0TZY0_OLEEU|nr:probable S-acyltransferase 23 [Olea europaea subsp. europaea]